MNIERPVELHVLADGLAFPESPRWHDGRLWVSDWRAGEVIAVGLDGRSEVVARLQSFPMCIDHLPDGRLLIVSSNGRPWAVVDDHPDGICLDAEGAVWYGDVGNQRCVRVREGGEVQQTIQLDRGCFACVLGGPDGNTLFLIINEWSGPDSMAAGSRAGLVLTVEAPAPGAGWPSN
jgi:sugar lactone lactonase YvrE